MALANADVAFVGVVASVDDPGSGPLVNSGEMLALHLRGRADPQGDAGGEPDVGSLPAERELWPGVRGPRSAGASSPESEDGELQTGLCSGNELLAENAPVPRH